MTLLSIVCPTKDRPALANGVINNFLTEYVANVELIVVDNASSSCRALGRELRDCPGVKYYRPASYLGMCDNWEYGLGLAEGKYVTFLMDKSLYIPGAIANLVKILQPETYDIVSWRFLRVKPFSADVYDSAQSCSVTVSPEDMIDSIDCFSPLAELKRRKILGTARGHGDKNLSRGRILTSAYHRRLVERVRDTYGCFFPPMSPDYTSTSLALSVAQGPCIDLNVPLITATQYIGNGANVASKGVVSTSFFKENITSSGELPIPFVRLALSNYVARDVYVDEIIPFGGSAYGHLDKKFFIISCIRDLKRTPLVKGRKYAEMLLLSLLLVRSCIGWLTLTLLKGLAAKVRKCRGLKVLLKTNSFSGHWFSSHVQLLQSPVLSQIKCKIGKLPENVHEIELRRFKETE